jgi:predicted ATPase
VVEAHPGGHRGPGTSDEVLDAVTGRTEGSPLFLEERVSSLLESRALVKCDAGRWQLGDIAHGEIPEALERLVRSRVDRLGQEVRDAVIAASVLGPELTFSALDMVTELDGRLTAPISELCSAGLFVELRMWPNPLTASLTL